MNFDISEEQQLILDSVTRFVQDNYELEARNALTASEPGFSAENWQMMADLGWLAVNMDESQGGFGGDQIDIMLLMEQFGKGLVVEPFLASVVLGAGALRRGGSTALLEEMLPGVIDGSRQLALAYAEEQARFDLHDVVTMAKPEGDDYILDGHKSMVLNAATASQIVISTRTSGGQVDEQGITLFLIDADSEGLELENFPTVDGLRASEMKLNKVKVSKDRMLGSLGQGFGILNEVAIDGILAISAEAIGAMEVLYKDTVAYTQEREQFDHPLAEFQVLQHRMVDMFMEYEQCKSLLYRATMEVVLHGTDALRTVHALKHMIGKAGIMISENAVQSHGGMGVTEELRVGHFFKRILVIDSQFGNSDYHLDQFAA